MAQIDSKDRLATSSTSVAVEQADYKPRFSCCYQIINQGNGNKICKVKFIQAPHSCPGNSANENSWKQAPADAIKRCLAVVPNYNYSQSPAGQINLNQAYILNPCNL
jgi:hypothetical protein